MQNQIHVHYYDGVRNIAHPAQLIQIDEQHFAIHYDHYRKVYAFKDVEYIANVGQLKPILDLPHDARIEFLDHHVPEWLNLKHKKMLHHVSFIEKSWRWIGLSFISVLLVIFATFKWGIPFMAYVVANNLPSTTLQSLGDQSEQAVIKYTAPSKLSTQRQAEITQLYQRLQHKQPAKIVFREGQSIGANALAVPNNTIILTDELVNLTQNDDELLGVLAHEQKHLDERHSLQQILQNLGMSIFYVVITGDSSTFLVNFPTLMINAQYSQNFELEADQNAIDEMKRLHISPQHMANFLQRLEKQHNDNSENSSSTLEDIFATHPPTEKRIQQIEKQIP